VSLGLAPSYAALCLVQGVLVAAPWRPWRLGRATVVGLLVPIALLAAGVAIVRGPRDGADLLAGLAAVATPALAAAAGWAWRRPRPWLPAALTGPLYLLAWLAPASLAGQAAAVALIAGACLTLAALLASLAPPAALAAGLVLLAAVDVALVWGTPQVGPATSVLHHAAPPALELPGGGGRPLPALQDATFGSALMGWLDLLAPALLATVLAGAGRVRYAAAGATCAAALLWGLLLEVTSPVPATVPVLAGLATGFALGARPALTPAILPSRP
jgi:hypothetical protein